MFTVLPEFTTLLSRFGWYMLLFYFGVFVFRILLFLHICMKLLAWFCLGDSLRNYIWCDVRRFPAMQPHVFKHTVDVLDILGKNGFHVSCTELAFGTSLALGGAPTGPPRKC
jgi:hypothetical protein